MRRTLATVVAAAAILAGTGLAGSASAVCGGGEPGGPCQCPSIEIKGRPLITC